MKNLGFGLMRLPLTNPQDVSSIDMSKLCEMADYFLERGYTYFDTAYMYHGGKSESAVQEALTRRHKRENFFLTSKLPVFYLTQKGDQERIFEEQRKRCGVDYFDNYLLHSLNKSNFETAEKHNSFGYVEKLKREGKVRHIGFSFHDTAEVLESILCAHPEMEFVQLQINYLDWEDARVQSHKCYDVAVKHGKKIIVMEPVKGGTLANPPQAAQDLLRKCHPDWSPASWALRFAASLPNVVTVLSGMSNMQQLSENTSFMGTHIEFGDHERSVIETVIAILNGKKAIPCTACRYCTETCPKNIAIPEYFSLYNEILSKGNFDDGRIAYKKFLVNFGAAADCLHCKKCERVCPQHLPVTEHLKKIDEIFGEH